MPNPSVTYTFSNSTTADATQVNQNFTDLINGMTDGTKDFSISALTCAGTATFNGAVTLGNATGDDITVTGSLASSIPIKTNATYDIGSSTLGLAGVYLGSASSKTTRLIGAATTSYSLTFPVTSGTAGYDTKNLGSGSLAFLHPPSGSITNCAIAASVGSSALTVALKGADGNDPSATNPVYFVFRSGTATTGTPLIGTVTGALSVVASSGSTLGSTSAVAHTVYVYAINNAGTVELAISGSKFDEGSLQTTTAEGGAGAADSKTVLYSTTARTNVPVRLIGRVVSTQSTAGTWATAPSELALAPFEQRSVITNWVTNSDAVAGTFAGFGTVTAITWKERRVGDTLEVQGGFTTGTVAGTTASITLPSSYVIDSSKLPSSATGSQLGFMVQMTAAANLTVGAETYGLFYDNSDTAKIYISWKVESGAFTKNVGTDLAGNSVPITFFFRVPCAQFAA